LPTSIAAELNPTATDKITATAVGYEAYTIVDYDAARANISAAIHDIVGLQVPDAPVRISSSSTTN
jgi:hypothetical protein